MLRDVLPAVPRHEHRQTRDGRGTTRRRWSARSRATSDDFLHWSPRQELEYSGHPPTLRESFYTFGLSPYFRAPHVYVGLAMRFMDGRKPLTDEQVRPLTDELESHGWQGWDWIGPGRGTWLNDECTDGVMLTTARGVAGSIARSPKRSCGPAPVFATGPRGRTCRRSASCGPRRARCRSTCTATTARSVASSSA